MKANTISSNLTIEPDLMPQQIGDPSIPLAHPRIEQCLVRVVAAYSAIITTALTGSCFHSRNIGDPKLFAFLSGGKGRLVVMDMPVADRTSFHVRREDFRIILRINVTADRAKLWSVELKFVEDGSPQDGLLQEVIFY